MGSNATERSDCLRNDSDIDRSDDDSHWECVASAAYLSKGGDSGSPVFVRRGSGNDVVLVGVHVRNRPDPTAAGFIPIDRIYAESLAQGYDWNPIQLRPVPVLDRQQPTQGAESLGSKRQRRHHGHVRGEGLHPAHGPHLQGRAVPRRYQARRARSPARQFHQRHGSRRERRRSGEKGGLRHRRRDGSREYG